MSTGPSEAAMNTAQGTVAVDAAVKPTKAAATNAIQVAASTPAETKEAAVQADPEITEVAVQAASPIPPPNVDVAVQAQADGP
jgi:hypothetical protein